MEFTNDKNTYRFKRYPESANLSLRAWSAADEYLLAEAKALEKTPEKVVLVNDRFGFLACNLHAWNPVSVLERRSQEKALRQNIAINGLFVAESQLISPLGPYPTDIDLALMQIPKSVALFKLHLAHIAANLQPDGQVLAGFMTRHFTPALLAVAESYFGKVEQSRALKKSRFLRLSEPKPVTETEWVEDVKWTDHDPIKQYPGVFSAGQVDFATQFLLDYLPATSPKAKVLDLAAGSGVLAMGMAEEQPHGKFFLLEDQWLALESAKLNMKGENVRFSYNDTLDEYEDDFFDVIISNPPFHVGHEVDINIPLGLFKGAARCLRHKGEFRLVANQHLNYATHLRKLFRKVDEVITNDKYVIYACIK